MSRSTLMNAHSCYLIIQQLEVLNNLDILRDNSQTQILEIGSGFGELARQLVKFGGARNCHFHFVDLPHNLFFAELYLSQVFGAKSIAKSIFNIPGEIGGDANSCQFSFYLPSELEDSPIKSINFAVNTYSLQEMEPITAKAYVDYIRKNLNSKGVFFSINAPSKWNIKRYSDYNYQTLKCLNSIQHRLFSPAGTGATVPVFNTFKLREQHDKQLDARDIALMDAIGGLQALGLGRLLEAASEGGLSITDPDKGTHEILHSDLKTKAHLKKELTLFDLVNDSNSSKIKILRRLASAYYCYYSDSLILKLGNESTLGPELNSLYSYLRSYYGVRITMRFVFFWAVRRLKSFIS